MHKELKIIKGLQPIPGDAQTAEPGVQVVNLLNEVGIILRADAEWVPQRPQARVVYGETPLSDGRLPLTSSVGNVVETLPVYIAGGTVQAVASAERELQRLIADARDFHTSEWQIDPVYLMWWADCAPGPQYALIYNMDLAPSGMPELQGDTWIIEATLTIERDAVWRPIPPGANPALWTEYFLELTKDPQYDGWRYYMLFKYEPPVQFALQQPSLGAPSGTGVYDIYETIDPTDITMSLTHASFEIPAEYIPGDAPALWMYSFGTKNSTAESAFAKVVDLQVAVDTRPLFTQTHKPNLDGTGSEVAKMRHFRLNAGDATAGGSWTKTNNGAGAPIPSNGQMVNGFTLNRTFTTTAVTQHVAAKWPGLYNLDQQTMRGRYAVFLRHDQSSASGDAGTVTVQLRYGFDDPNPYKLLNPSAKITATSATICSLLYLGTINIPINDRSAQAIEGWGAAVIDSDRNLEIELLITKAASSANVTVRLWDLVLMPIDEGYAQAVIGQNLTDTISGQITSVVIDNTGYMNRGLRGDYVGLVFHRQASFVRTQPAETQILFEVRGTLPTLKPGENNQLKFIAGRQGSGTQRTYSAVAALDGILHVLPGWYGVRDR